MSTILTQRISIFIVSLSVTSLVVAQSPQVGIRQGLPSDYSVPHSVEDVPSLSGNRQCQVSKSTTTPKPLVHVSLHYPYDGNNEATWGTWNVVESNDAAKMLKGPRLQYTIIPRSRVANQKLQGFVIEIHTPNPPAGENDTIISYTVVQKKNKTWEIEESKHFETATVIHPKAGDIEIKSVGKTIVFSVPMIRIKQALQKIGSKARIGTLHAKFDADFNPPQSIPSTVDVDVYP